MKKNYFFTALLVCALAVNLNAQFVELDGKEPVFHLKFEDLVGGRVEVAGTDAFNNFVAFDGTLITNDTILGHAWGGGTFDQFTFLEQVVNSDNFAELFLPAMFWDSYVTIPDRPQGIAAYSNNNGGYLGPIGTTARTISCYLMATDSTRVDTAGTAAWGGNPFIYDVGKWDVEGGGGMVRWLLDPSTMKFEFDWGLAKDFSAENMIARNEWVHLALTIPEGGARADVKFYINGVPQEFVAAEATGPETVTLNTTGAASWDGIRIGRWANIWMADYRVYNAELTEEDFVILLGNQVSVQNFNDQNSFNIYPVPNNGIFTIERANSGLGKVVITNTLGQVVFNKSVDQTEVINVSDLPTGVYFVSLSDGMNNIQTQKVLIK